MVRKRVAPKDYNNPNTRALTSKTFIGKIGEILGIKEGLSPDQAKLKEADFSKKNVRQALKRFGLKGAAVGVAIDPIITALKKYQQSNVRKKLVSDRKDFNKMMAEGMGMKPKPKRSYSKTTSVGAKDKGKTTPLKSVSVKGGDTLIALSKKHGVALEKLKQLNPKVKPRQMQIGSRIKLR
tara:strand:- start:357 stop:899 length:543 start_codon:yes stop_codon:yes gene_type:complete